MLEHQMLNSYITGYSSRPWGQKTMSSSFFHQELLTPDKNRRRLTLQLHCKKYGWLKDGLCWIVGNVGFHKRIDTLIWPFPLILCCCRCSGYATVLPHSYSWLGNEINDWWGSFCSVNLWYQLTLRSEPVGMGSSWMRFHTAYILLILYFWCN